MANLARVMQELRAERTLSRADLARRTGLAVPTIHRLVSDLAATGLVDEQALPDDDGRLGRPPTGYRFRSESGVVAGVDIGNETTRIALADLGGDIIASRFMPTDPSRDGPVRTLAAGIRQLLRQVDAPLVGLGVGIASVVDPDTGLLRNPPQHRAWADLPLGDELARQLNCGVDVEQDDHLAALAECSNAGTAPGAASVLVLQIGRGIGVGYALQGRAVSGALGRFGRIARWPVSAAGRHLPGRTLDKTLPTGGLVAQYHNRGGSPAIDDGSTLAQAARDGDRHAIAVLRWAGNEVASILDRLDALLAPDVMVFGGGLSGSFDVLEPHIRRGLPSTAELRLSVLGDLAVVAGGVLTGSQFVTSWLMRQLERA